MRPMLCHFTSTEPMTGCPRTDPVPRAKARAAACYGCDKPYEQCGDVSMDDDIWEKISPTGDQGGLLCANCIMDRLSRLGLSGITVTLYPAVAPP